MILIGEENQNHFTTQLPFEQHFAKWPALCDIICSSRTAA